MYEINIWAFDPNLDKKKIFKGSCENVRENNRIHIKEYMNLLLILGIVLT
jgi:hypothetical protein